MTRHHKASGTPKWVAIKYDGHTLRLLNVTEVASRPQGCPETVLLQVPDAVKNKLDSGNELLNLLNNNNVFYPKPDTMPRPTSLPGSTDFWHLIVLHTKACAVTGVWIPVADCEPI